MTNEYKPIKDITLIMQRIPGSQLYRLGSALQPLRAITNAHTYSWARPFFYHAHETLDQFLHRSLFQPRTCLAQGEELMQFLKTFEETEDYAAELNRGAANISELQTMSLRNQLDRFEAVLTAELDIQDLYIVFPKGGYRNDALLSEATEIFPPGFADTLPAARRDIEEVGRCIAFELATAAAFHLNRVYEIMVHYYYEKVTGGKGKQPGRNLGEYFSRLKKEEKADQRVVTAMESFKDLHRNPIIHPEQFLDDVYQAIALKDYIGQLYLLMERPVVEA